MSTVSILCVTDVEQTSALLQDLLQWESTHGGDHFDELVDNKGRPAVWLHQAEEHHARFKGAAEGPRGLGISIYTLVEDIEQTYQKAQELKLEIVEPLHVNPNAHFREFTLRLSDGYQFTPCERSEWLKL